MDGSDSLSTLVERARSGERAAEETVCRRFAPAVRAFARRRLRGKEAIDEFTQDVLLLTIEALRGGRVRDPERLGAFVLGICRSIAFDRARQRERRQQLWETYGAALEAVSVEVAARETYAVMHLEDCLSQVSKRARELIRLGYVESCDHEEVARALQISEANARVLRHRTLTSLRECLSKRISWEAA